MIYREKVGSLLRKHGRAYVGIERPKGYCQMQRKACFRNAALNAIRREVTTSGLFHVDGRCCDGMHGIEHAWITLDGKHAVDQTLPGAPKHAHFGIEFPYKLVARVMARNGYAIPLLTDPEIVAVLETAADAVEARAALRTRRAAGQAFTPSTRSPPSSPAPGALTHDR